MVLIDKLEFCHCHLNQNLNELVRAIKGARNITILGCSDVLPEHKEKAERYAKALETWLGLSSGRFDNKDQYQTVCTLLGEQNNRKIELMSHLIKRLRDNRYEFYAAEDEDFETPESRIRHLEICNFNWEQNLLILLDEIGKGQRTYGWHGVGLFCACGDKDPNNNYPKMVKGTLDSIEAADKSLLAELKQKLAEAYPKNGS